MPIPWDAQRYMIVEDYSQNNDDSDNEVLITESDFYDMHYDAHMGFCANMDCRALLYEWDWADFLCKEEHYGILGEPLEILLTGGERLDGGQLMFCSEGCYQQHIDSGECAAMKETQPII